jgi:hypothetical protein
MYKSISLRLAIGLSAISFVLFGLGFYSSSAASSDDQVTNSLGAVDSVRRLSLPTNDIVFNAADSKLYASVPGSASAIGNSIAAIDPYAGTIGTPVWVGSEPSKLALANDGRTLYTYLAGAYSIGRYDTRNLQLTSSFLIGQDPNFGLTGATDLAISPDDPNVVAVARQPASSLGPEAGVAVFNNGVRLPQFGGGFFYLAYSDSASTLYEVFLPGAWAA